MQNLEKYIVLDLETTGLDPQTGAEIMEFGAVRVENGKIVEEYETLIKPKNNPPVEIEILTGIKSADLETAPSLEDVRQKITDFIGDLPIVGHNIGFDLNFLRYYDFAVPAIGIDTCAIATTLIFDVASFSLETLSDYFDLPEESAHRAIGDVRSTQRLFEILRQIAGQIRPETKQEILQLGQKLNWTPALIFENENNDFTLEKKESTEKNEPNVIFEGEIPNKVLLSIPPHSEQKSLEKILQKYETQTLVIARNSVEAGKLAQNFDDSAMLFAPSSYLDIERLDTFTQNINPDEEIKLYFWLKIKIWQSKTQTGDTSELIFQRDDYPLWMEISAENTECDFFQKALQKTHDKKNIFSTLHSVFESPEIFENIENIVVLGTEELDFRLMKMAEKNIFSEKVIDFLQKHLPEENLLNGVDLFFGLAGSLVEKYTPDSLYPVSETINTTLQFTEKYKRLKEASSNLIQKFRKAELPFLQECADTLENFFQINSDIVSWITVYPNGNISLHANHIDLDNLLSQTLNLEKRKNIAFLSEHFFSAVMPFLKEELGLGGYEIMSLASAEQTSPMSFGIPKEKIPNDGWKSETNMQNYIEEQITQNEIPTVVIFSAKKILTQYFEHFFVKMNEANRMLLAEGCTGGVGKILNKFEKNQNPIIFISERTFRRVDFPKSENLLVLLHKLPFEWASPINQARSRKYENDFMDFSLPQALLNFDKLVTRAGKLATQSGKFLCLDRRITEKKYGSEFLKILEYRDKN